MLTESALSGDAERAFAQGSKSYFSKYGDQAKPGAFETFYDESLRRCRRRCR